MQVECQGAVRKAQAFAAFCNAENAMLGCKRKLFAELGRVASGVFTNQQVNGGRCWVNVPVDEQSRMRCLSWNWTLINKSSDSLRFALREFEFARSARVDGLSIRRSPMCLRLLFSFLNQ